MNTYTPKTHSSNLSTHSSKPFFSNKGEGSFFAHPDALEKPFFSPLSIQPKLTIGPSDDYFEREADQVADQVVQRLGPSETVNGHQQSPDISLKPLSISSVQRKWAIRGTEKVDDDSGARETPLKNSPVSDGEPTIKQPSLQLQPTNLISTGISATPSHTSV